MKKINTDLADFIGTYSITYLIDLLDSVKEDAEISWNSFGGSVYAGQKLIDYLNSKENKLTANVTGIAASMGAVLLPFFDHVKGAEQSDVMIHAASGGSSTTLKKTNQFLYEALAKKIDEAKFKEITGKELKDVMLAEHENIVDVWLTGKQAGEVGLYDETYDLLDKSANLESTIDLKQLDFELPEQIKNKYFKKAEIKTKTNSMEIKDVTAEMLQSGNKVAYEAIFNAGKSSAAEAKKANEIAFIKKYAKYDPDKAIELIEKGATLTIEDLEYFIEKKHDKSKVAELEAGSEDPLNPGKKTVETEKKTDEEKEKEASLLELRRSLGTSDLLTEKTK